MNANEFVEAVRTQAKDAAVADVLSLLQRPAGRNPEKTVRELSSWFNALSEVDRKHVRDIASMVSHHATFGVLSILDGVRVIENASGRGRLELSYAQGDQVTLLNDPNKDALHHLL